jgi:pimeloyl-ACP methyl ester carboxylesterase
MDAVVVLGSADGLPLDGYRILHTPPADGRYRLIGSDATALRQAVEHPGSVISLVLEAPTALHDGPPDEALIALMPTCPVPVLVLYGHADPQAHRGRAYRRLLPHCTYALVHGAGADVRRDRPAQYARVVRDFLARDVLFAIGGSAAE